MPAHMEARQRVGVNTAIYQNSSAFSNNCINIYEGLRQKKTKKVFAAALFAYLLRLMSEILAQSWSSMASSDRLPELATHPKQLQELVSFASPHPMHWINEDDAILKINMLDYKVGRIRCFNLITWRWQRGSRSIHQDDSCTLPATMPPRHVVNQDMLSA